MAFGNFLPHPSVADQSFVNPPKYFQDPWSERVTRSVGADYAVLIIGTGLSMVDFAMRFHRSGHRGQICAISTRGLCPAVHKLGHTYPGFFDEIRSMARITDLLKAVRRHVAAAESDGSDWRGVIDSLRPHTQELWAQPAAVGKEYFLCSTSAATGTSRGTGCRPRPPRCSAICSNRDSSLL